MTAGQRSGGREIPPCRHGPPAGKWRRAYRKREAFRHRRRRLVQGRHIRGDRWTGGSRAKKSKELTVSTLCWWRRTCGGQGRCQERNRLSNFVPDADRSPKQMKSDLLVCCF